jgi:DNA-binding SARP family transcriptional activator
MNDDRAAPPPVIVQLLGPVGLRTGECLRPLGGAKLRAILAQLALAEGRIVPVEQLIDGVWGEQPSANARNTLQYHVVTLRRALGDVGHPDAVRTQPPGYRLDLPTDLAMFARHRAAGNRAVQAGDAATAATEYDTALACWNGNALCDLTEFPFAERRAVALDAQRMTCLEAALDAELECDRAEALIPRLQGMVTEHPTRERLWEQLMVALYRTGRDSEALAVFHQARAALDRELGVEPSQRLRAVHQAVLTQDAELRTPSGPAGGKPTPTTVRTRLSTAQPHRSAVLTGARGLTVELTDIPLVIGRHSGCGLVLTDDEASRTHARVTGTASGHTVSDLASTNGTFVNGLRIQVETDLNDGDRIEIGHSVFRYQAAVE